MSRREAVVVVAAGVGRRLGSSGGGPKALVTVAGRTLLELALDGLVEAGVTEIVVVHTPGVEGAFAPACRRPEVSRLVPGGDSRTASVRAGLQAVPEGVDVIAVHDAARALTPAWVIRSVLGAVTGTVAAAAPAVPVPDTLKRVADGQVLGTVDRSDLRGVQTPQAFTAGVLRTAVLHAGEATDDLGLVEQARADGLVAGEIRLVPGSAWGRKITYPEDLELAAALLAARQRDGDA